MSSCACVATLMFLLLLSWFLGLRPIYSCVVFPPFLAVDLWSTTLQEAKKFTRSKFCWVDFELWTNLSCRCGSAALTEQQCRGWIWLRFELNFYRPIHPPLGVPVILQMPISGEPLSLWITITRTSLPASKWTSVKNLVSSCPRISWLSCYWLIGSILWLAQFLDTAV